MFDFGIKDIIDVLLVALLLYNIYKLMRESGTINIFAGVLSFIAVWIIVGQILNMRLLGAIMDKLMSVGVIVLVVLFQDEIRRFLLEIGSHKRWHFLFKHFMKNKIEENEADPFVMPLVLACINMARAKTGALIIIQGNTPLVHYIQTGELIDATVSSRLIENIFFKNSPLHDGAMIIKNNRVEAAGCILPISHDSNIPQQLGLRHRAALGIAQETDAFAIVISEETGNIAVAVQGKLHTKLNAKALETLLSKRKNEL